MATCYCSKLKPFAAPFSFIILQHPYEAKRSITTARMAHLSLTNSRLIVGRDFQEHELVNELINDPSKRNYMLFPSSDAIEVDDLFTLSDASQHEETKQPVFWVLDAKWAQVAQMLRYSPNIQAIPKVKFTPNRPSLFQIRKQPKPMCLSTIESVHIVIDRYFEFKGIKNQVHDGLIEVFQHLVDQQLEFARSRNNNRHWRAKLARANAEVKILT